MGVGMKTLDELKAAYDDARDAAWAKYYAAWAAECETAWAASRTASDAASDAFAAYLKKLEEVENENIG